MGITSRRFAAIALAAAALMALPGAAQADTEPNDGITQTEGPLAGGTVYSGTISTDNDRDWYAFYVSSQTQLDVAITVPSDSPCGISAALRNTDGEIIDDNFTSRSTTTHFRYTTAVGTNRYLLSFGEECIGTKYQFALEPAAAIQSGPGRAQPSATAEPNETETQAFGPIVGGQSYAAALETTNDHDWFYFYSSGTEPFDVSLSTTTSCAGGAELTGAGTDSVDNSVALSQNRTVHIKLTPPGPEKYLLHVREGCAGSTYEFRVDPPSAISTEPPSEPAGPTTTPTDSRCASAQRSVNKWSAKVRATKRKLRQRASRRRKRQLRDQLGAQKRNLKAAQRRVSRYC